MADNICLHIFTTSAAMVGVCLTVISLFRVLVRPLEVRLVGNEILGIDALAFLASCFLAYTALRTGPAGRRRRLEKLADAVFLLALTLMAVVCTLLVYELSRPPAPAPSPTTVSLRSDRPPPQYLRAPTSASGQS